MIRKMPEFDRTDLASVRRAAEHLARAYKEPAYIMTTAFGFTVTRQRPVASVAQYATVLPKKAR